MATKKGADSKKGSAPFLRDSNGRFRKVETGESFLYYDPRTGTTKKLTRIGTDLLEALRTVTKSYNDAGLRIGHYETRQWTIGEGAKTERSMVGFALYFSDSIDWGSALYLAEPLRVLRPWFGRSKYCQILLGINHIMEGATTDRIAEREIWHSVTRTVSFSSALGQWKTAIRYMQGSRDRYKDASIYGIEFRSEWRTDAKKPKHRKPKAKGKENTEHRRGSRHRN